jgi:hypothetical protein
MEPFDEALDRRIWSLADTRLQWHKRIAEARRAIPKEIETNVATLVERHRELDAASLTNAEDDVDELVPEEDSEHTNFLLLLILKSRNLGNHHGNIQDTLQKTAAENNELNQVYSLGTIAGRN